VKSFPLSFGKPLRHRPPWYFSLGHVATNYMKKNGILNYINQKQYKSFICKVLS
jgi:hypothetical protein